MNNVDIYDNYSEGGLKVAENFVVKEFACRDGSRVVIIHHELPAYLQKARNHFGRPLIITSAYRTVTHNARERGAANSNHIYGCAADIYIPGVSALDLYNYLCEIAGDSCEIGIYDNFVHFAVQKDKKRFDSRTK